ncbi:hypothetical protein [Butyrivibrio sp. M55]|uniref:hypothetical protein n=1 Tax=Butyrivibrio sp. M55 TaxID=1855323 RepID=UPI0008EC807E|nr:hypothetical protein [Butyrivibrio sp. M55]SFU84379.1 hypothetical protein SAMN05216540_11373 [Butyrivibrio sp. M55]
MHDILDIKILFRGMYFISCAILMVFVYNLNLYWRNQGKPPKSDNVDAVGEFLRYKQLIIFISLIAIMAFIAAFLLKNNDIFEAGVAICPIVLYSLIKADKGCFFIENDKFYVDELERFFGGIMLLGISNLRVFQKAYVIDISDEHKLQSLVAIVLLSFFSYLALYYFFMNLYILCGLKKWDEKDCIHKRIAKHNNRTALLKDNMRQYYMKHVNGYENKSKIVKIIFFVPVYIGLTIYSFINCCKQLINAIYIFGNKKMCDFIEASKSYLDNDKFLLFKKSTKQLCVMIALCFIYFWMNFSVGENSSLTKIVSGFATMIIIPIAINRYTS